MTKTEAIINSRPLTVETINDGQSPMPISPNNILTMKKKVVMPPPGNLICVVEVDGEEFNISVMSFRIGGERNLSRPSRNIRNGSKCQEISALVTLCYWKLIWWHGIIGQCVKLLERNSDDKGVVQSVKLLLGYSGNNNDKCILERPITKILLLLEVEDVNSPTKGV